MRGHVLETHEPLLDQPAMWQRPPRGTASRRSMQGEPPKSVLFAPLVVGDKARGVISLQNLDREDAFSEMRRSPAVDPGGQPERRARERAAVRRDAAPADRGRRAGRRAGGGQQRPAGPRPEPRHAGHVRPGGRQDPGDLRGPGGGHRHVRLRGWASSAIPTPSSAGCAIPTSRRGSTTRRSLPSCCARVHRSASRTSLRGRHAAET